MAKFQWQGVTLIAGLRFRRIIFCLLIIIVVAPLGLVCAEEESADSVTVSVKASKVSLPDRVAKRMELSIATVGEQVIVGRKVGEIATNREAYERIIKEVFDRVLVGYSVERATITAGKVTHIDVVLSPWGDIVRDIKLEIDFGAMRPETVSLIKQDLGNLEAEIRNILVGMPVESVDWSGGVTKLVIREALAEQLPEFRANLEIVPGPTTVVKLALLPAGPTVQDTRIIIRSQSIPNILLLEARPPVEEAATKLRGLPVAFVERHGDFFNKQINDSLINHAVVKRYGLTLNVNISAGTDTEVKINAETNKYRVTLEGLLDVGRKEDNTSAILHFGRYFAKQHEFFVETTFITSTVAWKVAPGWGYHWDKWFEAGLKYDLNNQCSIIWAKRDLGKNWSLRLERLADSGYTELGLRYKLHEFLSAEYVFTSDTKWLRLVGNL
ncbi:MAG: hypothetical protein H6Q74_806 [Firmicutes bacterium]|nr:hypothetical protein [Bacillota bacterium]